MVQLYYIYEKSPKKSRQLEEVISDLQQWYLMMLQLDLFMQVVPGGSRTN